jgi:hypothetical protein
LHDVTACQGRHLRQNRAETRRCLLAQLVADDKGQSIVVGVAAGK